MSQNVSTSFIPDVITQKPLQATKLGGILITLVLGIAGFFRVINAEVILGDSVLGDGQFLALILIPVASFLLICVVFLETVVTAYRFSQSKTPLRDQFHGRRGYVLLRGGEAAIATVGVIIIVTALPTLFAKSTPAPVGVGVMLLLMAVGIGILISSFARSCAEIFIYRDNDMVK